MRQISILIVNDDPNSCKLFTTYCTLIGYNASSVGSAELALAKLATTHPDLIILDMNLPGMNGMTLLHTLKADPATCNIHVIATTVYHERYDRKQVMEAGADGFLIVPTDRVQIMKLVTNTISEMLKER